MVLNLVANSEISSFETYHHAQNVTKRIWWEI